MFDDALAKHQLQSRMGEAYERELETLQPSNSVTA